MQAISYLHDSGIIHRDIKAANIMLCKDGSVKLGDFGVSVQSNKEIEERPFAGSPFWMAPEVAKRLKFDEKADIWSFGVTMIEVLYGRPPLWQLDPARAVRTIAKAMPPRLEGDFSKDLKDFVNSCLHDDPEQVLFVFLTS